MSGNVHQSDKDKLKATVDVAADQAIEVTQDDAAKLKGTVTQAEKDRTITGTVVTDGRGFTQPVSGSVVATQPVFGNLNATVHQPIGESLQAEVAQPTAAKLKATVTQAAKDRTVTGSVTANPTPLSTMLSSAITLTNADTAYKLPATEQSGRTILVIYNISDTTVYIGGAGVSTAAGMPLASSKYMVVPASANIYAVCGSAGKILRLSECK